MLFHVLSGIAQVCTRSRGNTFRGYVKVLKKIVPAQGYAVCEIGPRARERFSRCSIYLDLLSAW
jgi:hypothetical protein